MKYLYSISIYRVKSICILYIYSFFQRIVFEYIHQWVGCSYVCGCRRVSSDFTSESHTFQYWHLYEWQQDLCVPFWTKWTKKTLLAVSIDADSAKLYGNKTSRGTLTLSITSMTSTKIVKKSLKFLNRKPTWRAQWIASWSSEWTKSIKISTSG